MTPVVTESLLGYHPFIAGVLTDGRKPAYGQCQVGSLTGAVASQNVTEAPKGSASQSPTYPVHYLSKFNIKLQ